MDAVIAPLAEMASLHDRLFRNCYDGADEAMARVRPAPEQQSSMPFPLDDPTRLGGLAFLLHHEAFHIGQLALLRKHVGRDAMSYE